MNLQQSKQEKVVIYLFSYLLTANLQHASFWGLQDEMSSSHLQLKKGPFSTWVLNPQQCSPWFWLQLSRPCRIISLNYPKMVCKCQDFLRSQWGFPSLSSGCFQEFVLQFSALNVHKPLDIHTSCPRPSSHAHSVIHSHIAGSLEAIYKTDSSNLTQRGIHVNVWELPGYGLVNKFKFNSPTFLNWVESLNSSWEMAATYLHLYWADKKNNN